MSRRSFDVRALEMHSSRIWDQRQVENAFEFMSRYHLNTLIFHQNDIIEHCVAPESHFPNIMLWKRWSVRYHRMMNNRYYLNNIVRLAKSRNFKLFVEVKEIWFDEWLLTLYPELHQSHGGYCASDPFWMEFLEAKINEFLDNIPDIAGIIVSAGTRESKVSITTNSCPCDRCKQTTQVEWYTNLINAMYRPLKARGKSLVVRDFTRFSKEQNAITAAVDNCSDDIVLVMKNTPHDFYPTFPHNPKIGTVGHRPQWIEYDTWGQFYGTGFFPAGLVEDIKYRLEHCYQNHVIGVQLRCDWENMTEASTFNSLNILNTIAGAMLTYNLDTDVEDIYKEWAYGYGLLSPLKPCSFDQKPEPISKEADYRKVRDFMKASWQVMVKSAWIRGHVYSEDCLFPDTMYRAFAMMFFNHNMEDWVPGASATITATDDNIDFIFREKEAASAEVLQLPAILDIDSLGLSAELAEDLKDMLDMYGYYVKAFEYSAKACYLAQKAMERGVPEDRVAADKAIEELAAYAEVIRARALKKEYHHHEVYWMLDHKRMLSLAGDIARRLDANENYEYFVVDKDINNNHNLFVPQLQSN